jgi:RNA polymerase sigma-70 factor, ECF subfamily
MMRRQFVRPSPSFAKNGTNVALSEFDRTLLRDCLEHIPRSWENFVDRFLGVVVHVVSHTAKVRSIRLQESDREDLVAEVFLAILKDDFAVLRSFRGESSLATFLTVVARRVVVRELLRQHRQSTLGGLHREEDGAFVEETAENRMHDRDEVARLLEELDEREAEVIRMYHLEGKSYREISTHVGVPENSIGPTLSRARTKMREARNSSKA